MSPEELEAKMNELLKSQPGGTLVTLDPEGWPYPTYVLFAATERPDIIFASFSVMQHAQNAHHRKEAAFLVDARDYVKSDPQRFDRLVIQGLVDCPECGGPDYAESLEILRGANAEAAAFVEKGAELFVLHTRRLKFSLGLTKHVLRREF